jgi:hypothetical protein
LAALCFLVLSFVGEQDPASAEGATPDLPRFSLEVDAWDAGASGWIFITRGSRPGTATRAREGTAFGLDSGFLPVGKARVSLGEAGALGLRAVSTEETGTKTAEQDFVYHGNPYSAGRRIQADVGFLLLDLDYQLAWKLAPDWTLTSHLGAEYWGFSSRLRTTDALPAVDEQRSFASGYWLGGVDLEVQISASVTLNFSLLGGSDGVDRYFIEAEAGAGVHLIRSLALKAAYRVHEVRFHTSTNEANLLFHGPSLGLELAF